MIRASIYGRLGADAVARNTRAGKAMATATMAVNVARPGSDSEDTEWVSLVAFGATGDTLLRHQKGDLVAVMGQLTRSRFTGRDGQERSGWSLTAESIVSARTTRPSTRRQPARQSVYTPPSGRASVPNDGVDDLFLGDTP